MHKDIEAERQIAAAKRNIKNGIEVAAVLILFYIGLMIICLQQLG